MGLSLIDIINRTPGIKQVQGLENVATEGAKALWRSTPMGQAGQAAYNAKQPMVPQPSQPNQLQVGSHLPVTSVDGFYPQNNSAPMDNPSDVTNYYQPAYQDPQATVYGGQNPNLQTLNGAQQPAGSPLNPMATDPFGWLRNYLR